MSSDMILYIKGDRDTEVTKPDVTLGDILSMECADKTVLPKIKTLRIIKFTKPGQQRCVISILRVIERIHEEYPRLQIENMGETDIIVTYEDQKTPPKAWHIMKTAFVAAVTFFGAAFSIMAFNNDVDVTKLFGQLYELVTGQETGGFTILEITYSIGITAGILIFFNHFGKKRFTRYPDDSGRGCGEKGGGAGCRHSGHSRSFWQQSDLARGWPQQGGCLLSL